MDWSLGFSNVAFEHKFGDFTGCLSLPRTSSTSFFLSSTFSGVAGLADFVDLSKQNYSFVNDETPSDTLTRERHICRLTKKHHAMKETLVLQHYELVTEGLGEDESFEQATDKI